MSNFVNCAKVFNQSTIPSDFHILEQYQNVLSTSNKNLETIFISNNFFRAFHSIKKDTINEYLQLTIKNINLCESRVENHLILVCFKLLIINKLVR